MRSKVVKDRPRKPEHPAWALILEGICAASGLTLQPVKRERRPR